MCFHGVLRDSFTFYFPPAQEEWKNADIGAIYADASELMNVLPNSFQYGMEKPKPYNLELNTDADACTLVDVI
jgi:hypothetical protein